MREILAQTAPRLRRYAHALLGSWPTETAGGVGRLRGDQDADDLVHQALLGFWRAGFGPVETRRAGLSAGVYPSPTSICPDSGLKLALYRRVTALARQAPICQPFADIATDNSRRNENAAASPTHGAWAPEARALPRLSLELRALIALVTLERLNYQQTAEALDMPQNKSCRASRWRAPNSRGKLPARDVRTSSSPN